MTQSDMASSISYKQQKYLKKLVEEREEFDADWFNDLKETRIAIDDLSSAQASEFNQALAPNSGEQAALADGLDSRNNQSHSDESSGRLPSPCSPE